MKKKKDEAVNQSSLDDIANIVKESEKGSDEGSNKPSQEHENIVSKEEKKEEIKEGKNPLSEEEVGADRFNAKNIDFGEFNKFVYTENFKEDIRRTYKIKKKHVKILDVIRMKNGGNVDLRELVMEAIEHLYKTKYQD